MDANTIRIILIIVGALLIIALFLWERSRRAEEEEDGDYEESDAPYGLAQGKREPRVGAVTAVTDQAGAASAVSSAHAAESGEPESRAATPEPLLIQLSVSARREPFDGLELMEVAESVGLRPGRMEIFHCLDEFDDDTRIYFSMANMVKPGTFPFQEMTTFKTPGLMLFAQLDGRPEDMTILEEMIATARKLATDLDGVVLDETRRPLTVNKEEMMRQAVLEHERRWTTSGTL
ncbi:cell division protein ZipA [Thiocapsa imhoffii]|uniref:Cell division protein ZipA n=1 Tax=Thiocapsa imhoffii TaxID=382777 RepID=A0A9X1B7F5_9GAMM|nr:cell division protein ZipA [Thiocapsa imhoffii]MBK1643622.1 cell division protein ZipA [Thiocapsa imhoffii]